MWGPDPPTAKAISNRFYNLRALAREHGTPDIGERVGSKKIGGLVTPTSSPKSFPKMQPKRVMSDEPEEMHQRPPKRRAAQVVRSYNIPGLDSDDENVGVKSAIDSEESDVEWIPADEVAENDVEGKNGIESKDVISKAEKEDLNGIEQKGLLLKAGKEDLNGVEQKDLLLKAGKEDLAAPNNKRGLGAPFAVIIHVPKRICST